MNCLKCGRETDQTFCGDCRASMAKYPVNPGTIVQIPKSRVPKKTAPRRAAISLDTKLKRQEKIIRGLAALSVVLLIATCMLGTAIYQILKEPKNRPMGQNYSTIAKPTEEPLADSGNDQ